jgi:competence protein ComEC
MAAIAVLVMIILASWFGFGVGHPDTVRFFDVGQGDASLITCGNTQLLIDGGPDRIILNRLGQAMPFFDRHIEYVLLSHPHDDHAFGLFGVLDRYDVGTLLVSEFAAEEWRGRGLESFAREHGTKIVSVSAGEAIDLCPNARLEIVWPSSDSDDLVSGGRDRANDLSVVAKLVSRNGIKVCVGKCRQGVSSVLYTGDITATAEQAITASGADISADALKVPHHGSRYSSVPAFLRRVEPDIAVIQVGENRYGQPSFSVMMRLKAMGASLFRTDLVPAPTFD